jgi:Rrf2 family protein
VVAFLKLSTKGEYGLRAVFDLAQRFGQGPISLKSVAERQEISEHYLEQLIAVLRKAGLVKSVRGAQGGYILARDPQEVTVGDVIRVLEGPIAPMDCVNEEEKEYCSRSDSCVTKGIWEKVRDSINEVLDSITLRDMCEEAEKVGRNKEYLMYHI